MTAKKTTTTPRTRKPASPPAATVPETTKPFYAYIGVSDLAIARVRTLPDTVKALPEQVRALQDRATDRYTELAVRGEKLVSSIRNQGATEQAEKAARSTLAQARGLRTTAQRAAKQTFAQARGVRTSASKTVDATTTAAADAADKIG
jgi:hypothetical protein